MHLFFRKKRRASGLLGNVLKLVFVISLILSQSYLCDFLFPPDGVAQAVDFPVSYADWSYRQGVTVTNSTAADLFDYQVKVDIDTQSLIAARKMNSDCSDLRFGDGTTALNYFIEAGCNTYDTSVLIKLPSLSASQTKTVYMYYGNAAATVSGSAIWYNLGSSSGVFNYGATLANGYDLKKGEVSAISSGQYHNCVLKTDGDVYCWGSNTSGQTAGYAGGDAVGVSSGLSHSCVLTSAGNVSCWGLGTSGQTAAYTNGDAVAVTSGETHNCVLTSAGNVSCWGTVTNGQTAAYTNGDAVAIASGRLHNCVLKTNGNVYCWGHNGYSQSAGYTGGDAIAITAGYYNSCALRSNGNVSCWGWNTEGQSASYTGGDAIGVTTGYYHTCALKANGNASCWGTASATYNKGQLAAYTAGNALALSSGIYHTCALTSGDNVSCWGNNGQGQENDHLSGDARNPFRVYAAAAPVITLGEEETNAIIKMYRLNLSGVGTQVAGTSQVLTITALGTDGNTFTAYAGDKSVVLSGANAVGAYAPTCTDKTGAHIPLGTPTTLSFAGGVATCNLKLYKTESVSINITDGTYDTIIYPLSVSVPAAAPVTFEVVTPAGVYSGVPFLSTIIARDAFGNGTTDLVGDTNLSVSSGTVSPAAISDIRFHGYNAPDGNQYGQERDIVITNSVAQGYIGYQTKVTLDTAALITAGRMQADCDDMRFAETSGVNVPYWIESGCNTAATSVWLKTDLPASGSKTVYLFYGNGSVSSASDGNGVFESFDDFSAASLDTAKWNYSGVATFAGGIMTMTSGKYVSLKAAYGAGYAARFNVKFASSGTNWAGFEHALGSTENYVRELDIVDTSTLYAGNHTTFASAAHGVTLSSAYNVLEVARYAGHTKFFINNLLKRDETSVLSTAYSRYPVANAYSGTASVDWIAVRQYAATEPTATVQSGGSYALGTYSSLLTISGIAQSGPVTLTVTHGSVSAGADLTVQTMDHFTVGGSATQSAGGSQSLTLTAVDAAGATYANYSGDKVVTFSGANSVGAHVPTCSDKAGTPVPFGTPTTLAFVNGVANCNLVLYKTETASIDLTEGAYAATGHRLSVEVASAVSSLDVSVAASQTAGTDSLLTLSSRDIYGNTVASYAGDKAITFSGANSVGAYVPTCSDKAGTPVPFGTPTTLAFVNGAATCNLKLYKVETAQVGATDGAYSGSEIIAVSPAEFESLEAVSPAAVAVDVPFAMSVYARDHYGNLTNAITGDTSVTAARGSFSPSSFSNANFHSRIGPDGQTYAFEKDLTVTNGAATDLTGYQVKLSLDTSSLIAAGSMQADCDDLRFSETDNANLPYWIESGCNTAATVVWVRTDLAASAAQTVYMYYGNPGVGSAADGNNVFEFFDDFNGSTLDTANKWIVSGTGTVTVSGGVLAAASTASGEHLVKSRTLFGVDTAVRSRLKSRYFGSGSQYESFQFYSGSKGMRAYYTQNQTSIHKYLATNTTTTTNDITGFTAGNYGVQEMIRNSTVSNVFRVNDANEVVASLSTSVYAGSDCYVGYSDMNYGTMYSDWVLVRKYVATEPTVTFQPTGSSIYAAGSYVGNFTLSDTIQAGDDIFTVQSGTAIATTSSFVDAMDHLTITGASNQAAGSSQTLTLTAVSSTGSTFTDYAGGKNVTFSGASTIGGHVPTCTDQNGADVPFGTVTTLSFAGGVATCQLKLYKLETAGLDVTDGTFSAAGHGLSVAVSSTIAHYDLMVADSDVVAGESSLATLTAADVYGNSVPTHSGDYALTFSGASTSGGHVPTCTDQDGADVPFGTATTLSFAGGVATCQLKLYKAETFNLTVTDGTQASDAVSIAVVAGAVATFDIAAPARVTAGEAFSMTLVTHDAYGNSTNVDGTTNLALSRGTISPASLPAGSIRSAFGPDGLTYAYKKDIVVTNPGASALSGYQVKMNLDTAALISSGKMQADCDDMRFGVDGGSVPYWIESGCNTSSTTVWLRTDLGASASRTISWYYGNNSVGSAADGSVVFDFFDDFSGSAMDASKWATTGAQGSAVYAGGAVTVGSTGSSYMLKAKSSFASGTAVRARLKTGHYSSSFAEYLRFTNDSSNGLIALYSNTNASYAGKYYSQTSGSSYTSSPIVGWMADTYAVQDIIRASSGGIFKVNDANQVTISSYVYAGADCSPQFYASTNGASITADWILVRKYAATEPTVAVGVESAFSGVYAGEFTISEVAPAGELVLTVSSGTAVGTANIFVDSLDHFVISGIGTQIAGDLQTITLTALGSSGTTFTAYSGDKSVTFSGANSVGGYIPACTDKNGTAVPLGTVTTLNFASGVATCNLRLYKTETAALGATDGVISAAGHELAVSVSSDISSFDLAVSGTVTAGTPATLTLSARDTYGNDANSYAGSHDIVFSGASAIGGYVPSCAGTSFGTATPLNFVDGVASCSLVLYAAETFTLSLTDGTHPASSAVTVSAATFNHFDITHPASTKSGVPFAFSLAPRDLYGNATSDLTEATTLSVNQGTINGDSIPASRFATFTGPDNRAYHYRRGVTLANNVASDLNAYQAKLTLDTAALISAGKMQSSCADLRFAETDNANIPYWIESGCNTSATIVWIKTDLLASAAKNLYMYYGNGSVSAAADGAGVFMFFDGFDGEAIDTAKWAVTGTGSNNLSGGACSLVGGERKIATQSFFANNVSLRVRMQTNRWNTTAGLQQFGFANPSGSMQMNYAHIYSDWLRKLGQTSDANYVYTAAATDAWSVDTYHVSEIKRAGNHAEWWADDVQKISLGSTYYLSSDMQASFVSRNSGDTQTIDWVAVRQYAATEPTSSLQEESAVHDGTYSADLTISGILQDTAVTISIQNGSAVQTSAMLVEATDHMHHFSTTGSAAQVAGGVQTMTISAIGETGDPYTLYAGDHDITLSGASTIGGYAATCSDKHGSDVPFGSATTLNFVNGVATCQLKLYKAETASIAITDGSYANGGGALAVTVSAGALSSFDVTTPASVTSGTAFSATIISQDAYGNAATDFPDDVSLSLNHGAISPFSIAAAEFSDSTYTGNFTISQIYADTAVIVTLTSGAATATDNISVTGIDEMDHLRVTGTASQSAGDSQVVTITAVGKSGNTFAAYSGDRSLTFSGANPTGAYNPTCDDIAFGSITTINFVNGVATCQLKLYKAETASIAVTDGVYLAAGGTLSVAVAPVALASFAITAPATAVSETSFAMSFLSKDAYGNTTTAVASNIMLSVDQGIISPASLSRFYFTDDGAHSANFTISSVYSDTAVMMTFTSGAVVTTQPIAVTGTNQMDHFVVSGSGTQMAGETKTLTVTAVNDSGATESTYAGSHHLTFSGASSVGAYAPTCSGISFGTDTALTFTNGVATCDLKLYRAGSAAINVSDGTFTANSHTLTVAVSSASFSSLTVSASSGVTSGTAFSATLTAKDAYTNTTNMVSEDVAVSVTQGSISPSTIASSELSDDGAYTGSFTIAGILSDTSVTAAFTSGGVTGTKTFSVVGIDETHHFTVTGAATQTAGATQSITITAIAVSGAIDTAYAGSHHLTFSGASSIGAYAPTCNGISFGTDTALTFTNGVATCDLKLYRAGSAAINVTDGTYSATSYKLSIVTSSAVLENFTFSSASTAVSGVALNLSATSRDAYGNTTTQVSAEVAVTVDQGTITPTSIPASAFQSSGVYTGSFVISGIATTSPVVMTFTSGAVSSNKTLTVSAVDQMDHFRISGTSSQTAGATRTLTLTAVGLSGNTYADYNGVKAITFSGANPVGIYAPSCNDVPFASPVTLNFTNGVATCNLKLYKKETAAIAFSDGTYNTSDSFLVTVAPAAISSIDISAPASVTSGVAFALTLTAKDVYGNATPTIGEDFALSVDHGSISASSIPALSFQPDGVYSGPFILSNILADSNITLTVSSGSITATKLLATTGVDYMDHISIAGLSSQVAGSPQTITLTAIGQSGHTYPGYTGTRSFIFSGADAIGTYAPSCTNQDGEDVFFGDATDLAFVDGVATCNLKLYLEGPATIAATDNTYSSASHPLAVSVTPAPVYSFSGGVPTVATSTDPFLLMLTAKDRFGNTTTNVTDAVTISADHGTVSPASLPASAFQDDGDFSGDISIGGIYVDTPVTLTFATGSVSQTAALLVTGVDLIDRFAITSAASSSVAGETVAVGVRILRADGSLYADYTGSKAVTLSGADASGPHLPTYTDLAGRPIPLGTSAILRFVGGVAATQLTFYRAQSVSVVATDGRHETPAGLSLDVAPAAVSSLEISAPAAAVSGQAFPIVLTARDPYGNATSDVADPVAWSVDSGTVSPVASPADAFFPDGTAAASLILRTDRRDSGVVLTARTASVSVTVSVAVSAESGSVAFLPPARLDISMVRIVRRDGQLRFLGLPERVAQFAVSTSADFAASSWVDIRQEDAVLSDDAACSELYFKFRSTDGAVSEITTYSALSDLLLGEGDIVRASDSFDVYVIKYANGRQFKRLLLSPRVFASYGHLHWENLKTVAPSRLDAYITSDLVRVAGNPHLYQLFPAGDQGSRRIWDASRAYDPGSVYEINAADRDSYQPAP